MKKPTRRVIWFSIIVILLVTVTFQYSKYHPNQVSLFSTADITTVEAENEWNTFRKSLNLSRNNTKIQNIELIVNQQNQLYSMTFDLIDTKDDETYTVYHYTECLVCEGDDSQTLTIDKTETQKTPPEYVGLMNAHDFFSQLDELKHTSFLSDTTHAYRLLYSSGWYETNQRYSVHSFALEGRTLVASTNKKTSPTKGVHLMSIGNNQPEDFQTDASNTKTVFLSNHF